MLVVCVRSTTVIKNITLLFIFITVYSCIKEKRAFTFDEKLTFEKPNSNFKYTVHL